MREGFSVDLATADDLDEILAVFSHAREVMRQSGNPNQWKDSYPPLRMLEEDIARRQLYVIRDGETAAIEGVFVFFCGIEPTYLTIDGAWVEDETPYGVIHRVAGAGRVRGIVPMIVEYASTRISNLRIDTHEDNRIMQRSLEKLGFVRCGTILLESGDARLAYQRCE